MPSAPSFTGHFPALVWRMQIGGSSMEALVIRDVSGQPDTSVSLSKRATPLSRARRAGGFDYPVVKATGRAGSQGPRSRRAEAPPRLAAAAPP